MSSRVKIQKIEIWENDLPTVCMICGVNPGQTKTDSNAIHTPFPLSLLGYLGQMLSWKKVPFPIVTCNGCKAGAMSEENMTKLFGILYTVAFFTLLYPVSTREPKDVLVPAIFYFSVALLHGLYFWTIGKKYAIRCVGIDHGTVAMEFPGGMWGVAYTTYRRDKSDRRLGRSSTPATPAGTPAATASPEGAAPVVVAEPKSGGGGIPLEHDNLARIPDKLPEFLAAVKEGDVDKVTTMLNDGADAFECLQNGMNALHISCVAGLMQLADLMLKRGVDANSEMDGGLTPMHLAVQSNNQSIVGMLLARKGNPNYKNHQGLTPLHWCAGVQDERLDPNNRYKTAQILVKHGGDISVKDKAGRTPADVAREGGEEKVAEAFSP